MKKSFILVLFSLLMLDSCGSFEEEKKSLLAKPTESKDLVNSFEINKDQAEHFKESTAVIDPSKDVIKEEEKTKTNSNLKVRKTKLKTKSKIENESQSKVVAKIAPVVDVSPYSSDFPQLFKDYDVVSKPVWEKFKPLFFQGEQSIIGISYLGVTAGYITMTSKDVVKMGDRYAYHYFARFKSKDAYRYFYWLDDSIESFIDKKNYLPIKYALVQREKKQNVDDLQLFDFKKLKVSTWYKRVKVGSNKDEHLEKDIPRYLQDSFSALQFVRGLPLHIGDKYDFPVSTRGETWLLKIEVMEEENLSVNGEDIKALRLKAETHFPGVLQKSGDINFWYSADDTRKLVKFQAKVKLGSIYGDLVEYKPGVLVK